MHPIDSLLTRRNLLRGGLALGASAFLVRGAYAEELARTPSITEGPFYPPKLPLDTDNDLLIINDHITPAVGEVTHLSGRVLSTSGEPMRNVLVEIWQCDGNGVYLAQQDADGRDSNFQGFGRFLTSSTGEYYFRTIKPVPYPGRTPHIHLKLKQGGRELLTTSILHQRPPAKPVRRDLSGHRRAAGERTCPRRFQAAQRIENQRACGPHGHCARPHAARASAPTAAGPAHTAAVIFSARRQN